MLEFLRFRIKHPAPCRVVESTGQPRVCSQCHNAARVAGQDGHVEGAAIRDEFARLCVFIAKHETTARVLSRVPVLEIHVDSEVARLCVVDGDLLNL